METCFKGVLQTLIRKVYLFVCLCVFANVSMWSGENDWALVSQLINGKTTRSGALLMLPLLLFIEVAKPTLWSV